MDGSRRLDATASKIDAFAYNVKIDASASTDVTSGNRLQGLAITPPVIGIGTPVVAG